MHRRSRRGLGAVLCCVFVVMVLLASCAGSPGSRPASPVTPAKAIPSAGAGASACSYQSSGVSGFARSPGHAAGSQLVLGRIFLQAGYVGMPVPVSGDGPWRYWEKRGILILAGSGPVLVSVPPSWSQRAAITYGAEGIVSSLALTACRQPAGVWAGYAGGIYLRVVTSCVPLVFTIGNRSATVRFSVAGRCS
jgi:hypothetical protein